MKYWQWYFKGINCKPGYDRLLNPWLLLHLGVGIILTILIQKPINEISTITLLPLAGALIGLSLSWVGSAHAILQTEEIEKLSQNIPGGITDYVFTFQSAIMYILIALICWGLGSLDLYEYIEGTCVYIYTKIALFTLASIAVRECWHIVLAAQLLLIIQIKIKKQKKQE